MPDINAKAGNAEDDSRSNRQCRTCGQTVALWKVFLPYLVLVDHTKPITGTWCGGSQTPPALDEREAA